MKGGLWLIGGLAAMALTVFFLDELRRTIEEGPRVVVVAPAAPELEAGAVVWVAGRPAGRVLSVRLGPDPEAEDGAPIVVKAALHREVAGVLRADASARITQAGVMAPTVLSLDPGRSDLPSFAFGDTIRASVALLDQDRTVALLDSLRAAIETGRPLARRLHAEAARGDGSLARLRRDSVASGTLERRLEALDRLLAEGRGDEGGALARLSDLLAGLERLNASLERLPAATAAGPGAARRTLVIALDSLHASLVTLDRDLRRGRGALGRALYDTAIQRQAHLLEARMDSLRAELLRNPLRWLRLRLF